MILDTLNKQLIEAVQNVAAQKSVKIDKELFDQINFVHTFFHFDFQQSIGISAFVSANISC